MPLNIREIIRKNMISMAHTIEEKIAKKIIILVDPCKVDFIQII